ERSRSGASSGGGSVAPQAGQRMLYGDLRETKARLQRGHVYLRDGMLFPSSSRSSGTGFNSWARRRASTQKQDGFRAREQPFRANDLLFLSPTRGSGRQLAPLPKAKQRAADADGIAGPQGGRLGNA